MALKALYRKHGFSQACYYGCKAKFGGMSAPDAKRLKALESKNNKLKKLLPLRNTYNSFEAFLPEKAYGSCVLARHSGRCTTNFFALLV